MSFRIPVVIWMAAVLSLVAGGCRKSATKRRAASAASRCEEFADEAAAALQESEPPIPDKDLEAFRDRALRDCRSGKLTGKAVSCFLEKERSLKTLRSCLPEDYLPERDEGEAELKLGPVPEGIEIPRGVKLPPGVVLERGGGEEDEDEEP